MSARRVKVSDLVGASEIADRLGVRRSTVSNWRARHADFPEPVFRSNYRWSAVVEWLTATKRITGVEDLLRRYPVAP